MKSFFIPALSLLILAACSKSSDTVIEPGNIDVKPVARPVGEPLGQKTSVTITSAGGEIISGDQSLKITIPAGAVTAATTFGIQEVKNTCNAAIGRSFQLLPHGVNFLKPVTITYAYREYRQKISLEDALGLAYQDAQGIWRLQKNATVNREAGTVSVQTTHFSNWALLQWLKIAPANAVVEPGKSLDLKVMSYIPLKSDDLLTPLVPEEGVDAGVGEGHQLPGTFIKGWSVGGKGSVNGNGAAATYHAPEQAPQTIIDAVTATLKDARRQLLLVSNITVPGEGITLSIGGGAPFTLTGFVMPSDEGGYNLGGHLDASKYVVFAWSGGTGSFSWNRESTVMALSDGTGKHYESFLWHPDPISRYIEAKGGLQIDAFGGAGEYVTGSFTASGAGIFLEDDKDPVGSTVITGYFRVKRMH
jgi:hypothetical protein